MSNTLFPLPPAETPRDATVTSPPRVERPNRAQLELRSVDLDGLLPPDHRARIVWEFVEGLDLSPLYAGIRAVEGAAGRPPIDPAILTALWLYATLEGVGSARALDRLCDEHDAYRWLCGGVGVNYHTLAAFRVDHADVLDALLTQSVAALLADGLGTKPADEARASTTDPEAAVMKMADGGFRPAYNVQFAADTESQVIVGLDVATTGTDQGQLGPMVRQLRSRYGRDPDAVLADAGFLR